MSIQTHMKSICGIVLALVLITGCSSGGDMNFNVDTDGWHNWPWPWLTDADFFVNKTYLENINATGHTNLLLNSLNGEVVITGLPGTDLVTVTAKARVGSITELDAQEGLNQLDVILSYSGNAINVRTEQPPKSLGRQYIVDYDITVPSDFTTIVNHVNGFITVNGIENSVYIVLGNGDVSFVNVHGDASVTIDNGSFYGAMYLNTDSEAEISTINGDIDLDIPATTSAELFARVRNGTIGRENLDLANVQTTGKTLQGILGDGSGLIDLETVNGNISIVGL